MFVVCSLDGLEVARSRDVRRFSQGQGTLFAGQSCRLIIFSAQDGEVGGPPRLGMVGRAGARGVVVKKACEAVKRSSEPVIQDLRGGARRRRGDNKVTNVGGERLPVSVVPPEVWGGRVRGRRWK